MRCEKINWSREDSLCHFDCPECGDGVAFPNVSLADVGGATFNCPHCLVELIGIVHDKIVVAASFHHYMNMHNPEWPVDGEGTHVIDMGDSGFSFTESPPIDIADLQDRRFW
jgi:hypothetical protein